MKALIRSIVPMWAYRRLGRLYSYLLAWREGPACILRMALGQGEMTHRFHGLLHPFTFRRTSEDINVVLGNIIRREALAGPLPSQADHIVDAGGYIGDTAALFLSRYPSARCWVLEPGSAHSLAERNLASYGDRAILMKAALMENPGSCVVSEADTGSHVVSASEGDVVALTMHDVLSRIPGGRVDILKVDIEGAELRLFADAHAWLPFVDCITIELHGDRAKREIPGQLTKAGFQLSSHGSLTIAVRRKPRPRS